MSRGMPERLNLAIARRCDVACSGCYTFFGRAEPDLARFTASVAAFARCGLRAVTISGGDPLTIAGLGDFIAGLRSIGVQSIKLDTVGVGLAASPSGPRVDLRDLADRIDYVGIPLDGWSDESVLAFRRGRPRLYSETVALLDALDALGGPPRVIVNTVAHRANLPHLDRIHAVVSAHPGVCQWNVFEYTPTDQAADGANGHYCVGDEAFARARARFVDRAARPPAFVIDFRSSRSRLGQYLLVNSDGEAWLPDERGRTLRLGCVFGREGAVLTRWREAVASCLARGQAVASQQPVISVAGR